MLTRRFCLGTACLILTLSLGALPRSTAALLFQGPIAGTLTASPSSASFGVDTTVTVAGTGWETLIVEQGPEYRLFFDGELKANQFPEDEFEQPSMTFTIPGTTSAGTHTITVKVVDENEEQFLEVSIPFVVQEGEEEDQCTEAKTFSKLKLTFGMSGPAEITRPSSDGTDTLLYEWKGGDKPVLKSQDRKECKTTALGTMVVEAFAASDTAPLTQDFNIENRDENPPLALRAGVNTGVVRFSVSFPSEGPTGHSFYPTFSSTSTLSRA